jgi:hypothetical protein
MQHTKCGIISRNKPDHILSHIITIHLKIITHFNKTIFLFLAHNAMPSRKIAEFTRLTWNSYCAFLCYKLSAKLFSLRIAKYACIYRRCCFVISEPGIIT